MKFVRELRMGRIDVVKGVAFALVFCLGWLIAPFFCNLVSASPYRTRAPVSAPSRMRDWRYLVIHHSGAMVGNEDIIEMGHLQRGMENGMAYHFLIGNRSAGLKDGEVVEGHRWKYQLQGGHSHQDLLNETGVGICLVGNFNRKKPTPKQVQALSSLVLKLQAQFGIDDDRIHGHGQYYGEDSDCPGPLFSWEEFWLGMDEAYLARLNRGTSH